MGSTSLAGGAGQPESVHRAHFPFQESSGGDVRTERTAVTPSSEGACVSAWRQSCHPICLLILPARTQQAPVAAAVQYPSTRPPLRAVDDALAYLQPEGPARATTSAGRRPVSATRERPLCHGRPHEDHYDATATLSRSRRWLLGARGLDISLMPTTQAHVC